MANLIANSLHGTLGVRHAVALSAGCHSGGIALQARSSFIWHGTLVVRHAVTLSVSCSAGEEYIHLAWHIDCATCFRSICWMPQWWRCSAGEEHCFFRHGTSGARHAGARSVGCHLGGIDLQAESILHSDHVFAHRITIDRTYCAGRCATCWALRIAIDRSTRASRCAPARTRCASVFE